MHAGWKVKGQGGESKSRVEVAELRGSVRLYLGKASMGAPRVREHHSKYNDHKVYGHHDVTNLGSVALSPHENDQHS